MQTERVAGGGGATFREGVTSENIRWATCSVRGKVEGKVNEGRRRGGATFREGVAGGGGATFHEGAASENLR
jgi:hypothetical protein